MPNSQADQQSTQRGSHKKLLMGIVITLIMLAVCAAVAWFIISFVIKNDNHQAEDAPSAPSSVTSPTETSAATTIQKAYDRCSSSVSTGDTITLASDFDGIYFKVISNSDWTACMAAELKIDDDIFKDGSVIQFNQESTDDIMVISTLNFGSVEGIIFPKSANRLVVAHEGCGGLYLKPESTQLQDDAKSLTIESGNNGWGNWAFGLSCVHTVVEMPGELSRMLEGNDMYQDSGSDAWDDYTVRWYITNNILKQETIRKR